MPGTSASHLIFFIAAVIVATAVAGIFVTTTLSFSKNIKSQADERINELNARIAVINDASAMPYNATCSTLILLVKNTGSVVLNQKVIALLDGNYTASDNLTYRLLDGASEWGSETVLEVTMNNVTLASGDHQVKVISQYEKWVLFKFKI